MSIPCITGAIRMETPPLPADNKHRSIGILKVVLLRRLVLMMAYWVASVLALYFYYPGEAPFTVFNILASWGRVLGYCLEAGGYFVAMLVFLQYLVGLFVINTVLAHYSKFRLPILQIILHWTGVYFAFNLYGVLPLPPVKEFFSVLGLVFVLTIFVLPSMISMSYIVLDWKFATKKDGRVNRRSQLRGHLNLFS